jgi:hypothetical protein
MSSAPTLICDESSISANAPETVSILGLSLGRELRP